MGKVNRGKTELMEKKTTKRLKNKAREEQELEERDEQGKKIQPGISARLLGMITTSDNTWEEHLLTGDKAVLPSCRKKIGALRYTSRDLPQTAKLQLANGVVMSRLLYGIQLWSFALKDILRKVQTVKNQAALFVINDTRNRGTKKLLSKCDWLSINQQICFHSLMLLWKVLKFEEPVRLRNMFEWDMRSRVLGSERVTTPPASSAAGRRSWRCMSCYWWNQLGPELHTDPSLKSFKKKLKKYIAESVSIKI